MICRVTSPHAQAGFGVGFDWGPVGATGCPLLYGCAGGRELTQYGFADDVAIAAEVDESDVVPVLVDGRLFRST
jgi:hypothetical protein